MPDRAPILEFPDIKSLRPHSAGVVATLPSNCSCSTSCTTSLTLTPSSSYTHQLYLYHYPNAADTVVSLWLIVELTVRMWLAQLK